MLMVMDLEKVAQKAVRRNIPNAGGRNSLIGRSSQRNSLFAMGNEVNQKELLKEIETVAEKCLSCCTVRMERTTSKD